MSRNRPAFTLIELLVVIAIIAVLIALLVPAVQKVRESANQAQCKNSLRQLALGCLNYAGTNKGLPLLFSSSSQPGWVTQILPYMEQTGLYNAYNFNYAWFESVNANVVNHNIPITVCPTSPVTHLYTTTYSGFNYPSGAPAVGTFGNPTITNPGGSYTFTVATTDYYAIAGTSTTAYTSAFSGLTLTDLGGAFGAQAASASSQPLTSITDGTSNTAMLGEMSGRPYLYVTNGQQINLTTATTKSTTACAGCYPNYISSGTELASANIELDYGFGAWAHNNNFNYGTFTPDGFNSQGTCAVNCSNYRGLYSFHTPGAHVAFADGSVHLISSGVSTATMLSLVTARGGETITDPSVFE